MQRKTLFKFVFKSALWKTVESIVKTNLAQWTPTLILLKWLVTKKSVQHLEYWKFTNCFQQSPSTLNGNDEFEVSFRGGVSNKDTKHSGSKLNEIVSGHEEPSSPTSLDTELNTCRILQRKLELKVERAKRNYYSQHQEEPVSKYVFSWSLKM